MCNQLKKFRTIEGEARRDAMRAYLTKQCGVNFADPYGMPSYAQLTALQDMAKAVSWRKPNGSKLSLGLSFFTYLARGVQSEKHKSAQLQGGAKIAISYRAPRRSFFLPA